MATRPTGARVREALFSMLGDVSGANVLDLYAGSGALGIEALSRGAARATFVEFARPALACLRTNLAELGLADRTRLLPIRAKQARLRLSPDEPFDLVFCDPPWSDVARALSIVSDLADAGIFGETARILVEHSAREALAPSNDGPLAVSGTRAWGDTAVSTLVRRPASS